MPTVKPGETRVASESIPSDTRFFIDVKKSRPASSQKENKPRNVHASVRDAKMHSDLTNLSRGKSAKQAYSITTSSAVAKDVIRIVQFRAREEFFKKNGHYPNTAQEQAKFNHRVQDLLTYVQNNKTYKMYGDTHFKSQLEVAKTHFAKLEAQYVKIAALPDKTKVAEKELSPQDKFRQSYDKAMLEAIKTREVRANGSKALNDKVIDHLAEMEVNAKAAGLSQNDIRICRLHIYQALQNA